MNYASPIDNTFMRIIWDIQLSIQQTRNINPTVIVITPADPAAPVQQRGQDQTLPSSLGGVKPSRRPIIRVPDNLWPGTWTELGTKTRPWCHGRLRGILNKHFHRGCFRRNLPRLSNHRGFHFKCRAQNQLKGY